MGAATTPRDLLGRQIRARTLINWAFSSFNVRSCQASDLFMPFQNGLDLVEDDVWNAILAAERPRR